MEEGEADQKEGNMLPLICQLSSQSIGHNEPAVSGEVQEQVGVVATFASEP